MNTPISEKVRTLRLEKRLTQDELASAAGVSRRAVSTMENEVYAESVNLSTLLKVLNTLGYEMDFKPMCAPTLDDLLRGQNAMPESTGASRVRKTRAELQQDNGESTCASMSM